MLDTLIDILLFVPRFLYNMILDGASAVFTSIPAPEFFQNIGNMWVSSNINYFLDVFAVPECLTILVSATILRRLISFIPFIN